MVGFDGSATEILRMGELSFLDQTSSQFGYDIGSTAGSDVVASYNNLPIKLFHSGGSGNLTVGDGTLVVTVYYNVINLL